MARVTQWLISKILFICVFLLTLTSSQDTEAHGLESRIVESTVKATTVDFQYSDSSPVSFAKVKIWSPDNDSIEFQNGRTDTNGRFSFFPDVDGLWRITVNDGMGHAATLEHVLSLNADTTTPKGSAWGSTVRTSRLFYAFFGCSLIINAGFLVGRFKEFISRRGDRKASLSTAYSRK